MKDLARAGLPVPPIVASDLDAAKPWYVMPWFPSGYLKSVMEPNGGIDHVATAARLLSVARAMKGVHEAGLAHRDLKPENVLIDDDGQVLITDFGLCLEVGDDRLTETMEGVGSRFYIAPENEGGIYEEQDQRPADFYAFAKICWVLITGRNPLPREQQLEPGSLLGELVGPHGWPGMDALFRELLARDPRARLQDWSVVLDELEGLLALHGGKAEQGRARAGGLTEEIQNVVSTLDRSDRARAGRAAREREAAEQEIYNRFVMDLSWAVLDQFDEWTRSLNEATTAVEFSTTSGGVPLREILQLQDLRELSEGQIPEPSLHQSAPGLIVVHEANAADSSPLYICFYALMVDGEVAVVRTLTLNDQPARAMVHVVGSPHYPVLSERVRAGGTRQRMMIQEFLVRSTPVVERTLLTYVSCLESARTCVEVQSALLRGLSETDLA